MQDRMDVFSTIYKSIVDFKFYQVVRRQKFTRVLLYLLILILLLSIPTTIRVFGIIKNGVGIAEGWINEKLPPISIRNGVVDAQCQQPFYLEEGDFTLIIDTTGEVEDLEDKDRGILIKKTEILYKENEFTKRNYDLSQVKEFELTSETTKSIKDVVLRVSGPLLLIVFILYFLIAKLLQALIFSLVGILTNKLTKTNLTYPEIYKISIVALTPAFILAVILETILNLTIPFFWLIYALITCTYIALGINMFSKPPETEEAPTETS